MDELKRVIQAELDPEFREKQKEAKQQRGFNTTGTKIVNHISKNSLEIYEVDSGAEYIMEYLTFSRIIGIMGFGEKELEIANAKLLNGYYLIFDFDDSEIIVYDPATNFKPIGKYLTQAKENLNKSDSQEEEYNPQEFQKWYNYINKT